MNSHINERMCRYFNATRFAPTHWTPRQKAVATPLLNDLQDAKTCTTASLIPVLLNRACENTSNIFNFPECLAQLRTLVQTNANTLDPLVKEW